MSAAATLVDPYRAGSVNEMGLETFQNRLTALPGRPSRTNPNRKSE